MERPHPGNAVYHCVFSSYGRKVIFVDEVLRGAEALVQEIATEKGYQLIACAVMPDHVHLLLRLRFEEMPRAMNMFKGIMSRRIFQQFPDLRIDMRSNHLWAAGYYARTVDPSSVAVTIRYIQDQGHPAHDI